VAFVAAFIVVSMVHEGFHAVTSALYGECSHFVVHPYGFEVVYRTPVELREGFRWFIISGAGNVATPLLGYLLLRSIDALRRLPPALGACAYWLTLMLLVADPLTLSLGPFLYGGDAYGVALGLGVPVYLVQGAAFMVFLLNRELVATRLLPAFGVETSHPLFVPWFRKSVRQ